MNLTALSRMVENLVRIGTVHEVDLSAPRCRVASGELVTGWLRMPSQRAGAIRKWSPLTVGEQVIILSPSGEPAAGIVLPMGIFSDAIDPTSDSADVEMTQYPDGAVVSYNHATHVMSISGVKDMNITATGNLNIDNQGNTVVNTTGTAEITAGGKATVTAPEIELTDGGATKGCVQGDSICSFTGMQHAHISSTVKASA